MATRTPRQRCGLTHAGPGHLPGWDTYGVQTAGAPSSDCTRTSWASVRAFRSGRPTRSSPAHAQGGRPRPRPERCDWLASVPSSLLVLGARKVRAVTERAAREQAHVPTLYPGVSGGARPGETGGCGSPGCQAAQLEPAGRRYRWRQAQAPAPARPSRGRAGPSRVGQEPGPAGRREAGRAAPEAGSWVSRRRPGAGRAPRRRWHERRWLRRSLWAPPFRTLP